MGLGIGLSLGLLVLIFATSMTYLGLRLRRVTRELRATPHNLEPEPTRSNTAYCPIYQLDGAHRPRELHANSIKMHEMEKGRGISELS